MFRCWHQHGHRDFIEAAKNDQFEDFPPPSEPANDLPANERDVMDLDNDSFTEEDLASTLLVMASPSGLSSVAPPSLSQARSFPTDSVPDLAHTETSSPPAELDLPVELSTPSDSTNMSAPAVTISGELDHVARPRTVTEAITQILDRPSFSEEKKFVSPQHLNLIL